jgi:hypothetical protein
MTAQGPMRHTVQTGIFCFALAIVLVVLSIGVGIGIVLGENHEKHQCATR